MATVLVGCMSFSGDVAAERNVVVLGRDGVVVVNA